MAMLHRDYPDDVQGPGLAPLIVGAFSGFVVGIVVTVLWFAFSLPH